MEKLKTEIVGVDRIAQEFGVSERKVQLMVIEDGLPRISRGEYDLIASCRWYMRFLHSQICPCLGPCAGFDAQSVNATNARYERAKTMKQVAEITAPQLVGKKVDAIRVILIDAVNDAYEI